MKLGWNSVHLKNATPNPTIDVIATWFKLALALFIDHILVEFLHDLGRLKDKQAYKQEPNPYVQLPRI